MTYDTRKDDAQEQNICDRNNTFGYALFSFSRSYKFYASSYFQVNSKYFPLMSLDQDRSEFQQLG